MIRSEKSLGLGLGLRPQHYQDIQKSEKSVVTWFEAVTENYMGLVDAPGGGRPLYFLEKIRERFPIAFHGVSLNIGSVDPLSESYLKRLKELVQRFEPAVVSDHLCWTGVDGKTTHDLLPLPFIEEAIEHVAARVRQVQDFLGREILLENVSSYITYSASEMSEWEFLSEVARRADCGILLDINNVFVSSRNNGFDPICYLEGVPVDRVKQFHIAGHSQEEGLLIDTHDQPVPNEVWHLYARAVARFGKVSTLLEWDDKIPLYADLLTEVAKSALTAGQQGVYQE